MIFFHTQAIHHPASSSETTTESVYDDEGQFDYTRKTSEVSRQLSLAGFPISRDDLSPDSFFYDDPGVVDLDLTWASRYPNAEIGWHQISKISKAGPLISPF